MVCNLQVGDKVLLASGGPEMIVESLTGETAITVWLDKRYRKRSEAFPAAGLTKLARS